MLSRQVLEDAIRQLAAELDQRTINATIWLVGGAVMVLAFDARESTADVDCAASHADEVFAIARELARRLELPETWIDDAAKVFIPTAKDPDWRPLLTIGSVNVVTADQRSMLAMKLRSSRGARDQGDIEFLLEASGITTEDEALRLYGEYFPEDPLNARARPMLRAALRHNNRSHRSPTD